MNGLPYDFTDKQVSPWGGLRLIEETYRRSGLKEYLHQEELDLPIPGSNRGYDSIDLAEAKMIANAWMRTGDSASSTDFTEFFNELLSIIPIDRIGLIRADSGFCIEAIMHQLEEKPLNYILATRMMGPLVRKIFDHKSWFPIDKGYWTGGFLYQAKGWTIPRRVVVVREDTGEHPNTGGKLLFSEIEEFEKYKYTAFVTNLEFSDEMIWHMYNPRADCENRIRELKYEYGIEGFCMEDFYATEAAFRWTMVAHNLMSLFRLHVLNNKHHPVLSTIRFQCIAIGSYLVKSARKTTLLLSAKEKRKQFLQELFIKVSNLSPPFQIPNE